MCSFHNRKGKFCLLSNALNGLPLLARCMKLLCPEWGSVFESTQSFKAQWSQKGPNIEGFQKKGKGCMVDFTRYSRFNRKILLT